MMIDRQKKKLDKRRSFRRCFFGEDGKLTPDAEIVLADLARFCRLHRSTCIVSPQTRQTDVPATFQAEGRREVILRILGHLHISDADVFAITEKEAIHD